MKDTITRWIDNILNKNKNSNIMSIDQTAIVVRSWILSCEKLKQVQACEKLIDEMIVNRFQKIVDEYKIAIVVRGLLFTIYRMKSEIRIKAIVDDCHWHPYKNRK